MSSRPTTGGPPHALKDDSVHTQGKTLDELTADVREVAELLYGEKDVQIELVVPSGVRVPQEPHSGAA